MGRSRVQSDTAAQDVLGRVLLPLRAFLGFTFCFAGLQKLASPAFFDAANPASIQAQLAGAMRLSPIHALISPLAHVAVLLGVVIAFGELLIGLATLLGLQVRLAAAGGMLLSFMLFLTISFHASPYYTGSDIVFVFAWTPLLLAGSGSILSADAAISRWAASRAEAAQAGARTPATRTAAQEASRREATIRALAVAAAAVASLIIGGIAAAAGRLAGSTAHAADVPGQRTQTTMPSSTPSATATPSAKGTRHAGKAIGPASRVPVGGAASFTDPASGDPSIVVQPSAGDFRAFDAVCPHAGCTVGYDAPANLFLCPCHGSEFNTSTGAVVRGPAPTGLTKIAVTKASNGQLYVT
jgi:thiosulfate dehydrogenase [quinone] large subunit